MLTEDHFIRMLNLAIAALLEAIGLKKAGDYDLALQRIDLAFELLLGLKASMAKNLEDERLYYLLTRGDRLDTQRLGILADLCEQEGDIYALRNQLDESREDYLRSLRYNLEVFFNEGRIDPSEQQQKIEGLVEKLDLAAAGSDTLWPLAGYYEQFGALARAEEILLRLAGRPEIQTQIRPELAAFYERVSALTPADLERGGLSAERVRQGQVRWGESPAG